MKNMILTLLSASMLLLIGCEGEEEKAQYDFSGYDYTSDPLANKAFCFKIARKELGADATLYQIQGVQKDGVASKQYETLEWRWFFCNDNAQVTMIDPYGKEVSTDTGQSIVGYELFSEDAAALSGILPVQAIWNSCTAQYDTPILYADIYIPLQWPPKGLHYMLCVEEGMLYPGITLFQYDAKTGEESY